MVYILFCLEFSSCFYTRCVLFTGGIISGLSWKIKNFESIVSFFKEEINSKHESRRGFISCEPRSFRFQVSSLDSFHFVYILMGFV